MAGVMQSVSSVFFAYIGFDAISTTAEECRNPQRDLPKGMMNSLLICTVIYVITALVITGLVNYKEFEFVADPLAYVFDKINMHKIGFIISDQCGGCFHFGTACFSDRPAQDLDEHESRWITATGIWRISPTF